MKKNIYYTKFIFGLILIFLLFSGAECTNLSAYINPDPTSSAGPLAYGKDDVLIAILRIIDLLSYYSIYVAMIFFLYGGISYITSSGDDEKIKKAKLILTWSVVGFIVVLASYAIIQYVLNQLMG